MELNLISPPSSCCSCPDLYSHDLGNICLSCGSLVASASQIDNITQKWLDPNPDPQVLVYLSPDRDGDSQILLQISEFEPGHRRKPPLEIKHVDSIFQRRWFNRVWVLQEIGLAKRALVYCGNYKVPWERFILAQFDHNYHYRHSLPPILKLPMNGKQASSSLVRLLMKTRGCSSTDPRDKVFALLGIVADVSSEELPVDYTKSPREVFTELMKLLIRSHTTLDILAAVEPRGQMESGLPSWVPDWPQLSDYHPITPFSKESIKEAPQCASLAATWVHNLSEIDLLTIEGQKMGYISYVTGTDVEIGTLSSPDFEAYERWMSGLCTNEDVLVPTRNPKLDLMFYEAGHPLSQRGMVLDRKDESLTMEKKRMTCQAEIDQIAQQFSVLIQRIDQNRMQSSKLRMAAEITEQEQTELAKLDQLGQLHFHDLTTSTLASKNKILEHETEVVEKLINHVLVDRITPTLNMPVSGELSKLSYHVAHSATLTKEVLSKGLAARVEALRVWASIIPNRTRGWDTIDVDKIDPRGIDLIRIFPHWGMSTTYRWLLNSDTFSAPSKYRFFLTHEGHFGLGPSTLKSGDILCKFANTSMGMFVRRHERDDRYTFVGACVGGVLPEEAADYGEGIPTKLQRPYESDTNSETFNLC